MASGSPGAGKGGERQQRRRRAERLRRPGGAQSTSGWRGRGEGGVLRGSVQQHTSDAARGRHKRESHTRQAGVASRSIGEALGHVPPPPLAALMTSLISGKSPRGSVSSRESRLSSRASRSGVGCHTWDGCGAVHTPRHISLETRSRGPALSLSPSRAPPPKRSANTSPSPATTFTHMRAGDCPAVIGHVVR